MEPAAHSFPPASLIGLYQGWDARTRKHFYLIRDDDGKNLPSDARPARRGSAGFVGYVMRAQAPDSVPLCEFFHHGTGLRVYTTPGKGAVPCVGDEARGYVGPIPMGHVFASPTLGTVALHCHVNVERNDLFYTAVDLETTGGPDAHDTASAGYRHAGITCYIVGTEAMRAADARAASRSWQTGLSESARSALCHERPRIAAGGPWRDPRAMLCTAMRELGLGGDAAYRARLTSIASQPFVRPSADELGAHAHIDDYARREEYNHELKRFYAGLLASKGCRSRDREETARAICGTTFDARDAGRDKLLRVVALGLLHYFDALGVGFDLAGEGDASDLRLLNAPLGRLVRVALKFRTLGGMDFEAFSAAGPDVRRRVEVEVRERLAGALSVPAEEVVVLDAVKGSVNVVAVIGAGVIGGKVSAGDLKAMDDVYQKVREGFERAYPDTFVEADVALEPVRARLSLAPRDFDPKGDFAFPNARGDKQRRGGRDYHQPDSTWKRLGLRVLGLYGDGDRWIGMDGSAGEWLVGFHGTGGGPGSEAKHSQQAFSSIYRTRTLVPGNANVHGGSQATNQRTPVPRTGIYFADNVGSCYRWRTRDPVSGDRYELAFQCRIDPSHAFRVPESCQSYIVADRPIYVRPYGILIKRL